MNNKNQKKIEKEDSDTSSFSDSEMSSVSSYSSISSSDILKIKENPKIKTLIDENIKFEQFDWKTYISKYTDLKKMQSKREAWSHWIKHGKAEGRTDKKKENNILLQGKEYENFNWELYVDKYIDLKHITEKESAWNHWTNHGKSEGRTLENMKENNEYKIFDWKTYVNNYQDLCKIENKDAAWFHWINHGKKEGRTSTNLKNNEYEGFLWETYIENYQDLELIDNKDEAWSHWINHGKLEGRTYYNLNTEKKSSSNKKKKTEILSDEGSLKDQSQPTFTSEQTSSSEISNSSVDSNSSDKSSLSKEVGRIIFKPYYDNYGSHYFGWKGSINYFVDNFQNKNKYKDNIFFDEWIEKLLLWGNKKESSKYLNLISKNNLKLITFIHNPPVEKWNIKKQQIKIKKETLVNDNYQFNENLFLKLEKHKLKPKLVYLYTLSNYHKEYIFNRYPEYKNNLVSIYHPLCLNCKEDELFDYNLFLNNKKIYNIGWWLRNFESFNKFQPPDNYKKVLLLKDDFKKVWEEKCKDNVKEDIKIVNELSNEKYVKIFKKSCIYLDMVDGIANNIVLECIKYNTPIIVNRLPSLEEYLGKEYPLFFDKQKEIKQWSRDENSFLELISTANTYLKNMNKTHISLDFFNNKINYDLSKLENSPKQDCLLTWICVHDCIDNYVNNFIEQFNLQTISTNLKLYIIISDLIEDELDYSNYEYNTNNIEFFKCNKLELNDFINNLLVELESEYVFYSNINDLYEHSFSEKMITYLNTHPHCDLALSSYNIQLKNELTTFTMERDNILFKEKLEENLEWRTVWRKNLMKVFNIYYNNNFLEKCFYYNLNGVSVSTEPLYTICK